MNNDTTSNKNDESQDTIAIEISPDNEGSEPSLKVILVVDDSIFVRTSVKVVLEKEGYKIVEAADGYEAVEKSMQILPHLILMDLSMPNMDGFKAAETIRKHPKTSAIPIVIVTAHATKDHVIKGKLLGISGFLVKPFDLDDLIRTVQKAIT